MHEVRATRRPSCAFEFAVDLAVVAAHSSASLGAR
jgi:hypothetical protein